MSALCFLQKKRSKRYKACSDVVEVAGLEPTASASRTQRSTKLSHTSLCNWGKKKMVEVAGLEPTASASRTQRSTKLSHTSSYFLPYQGQIPDATMIIISEE